MARYRVKDWHSFQHYNKPNPTWIKLYIKCLYDRSIMTLDDFTFKLLMCCWMLAAEDKTNNGILPDSEDIAYTLRKPKSFIDKHLEILSIPPLDLLYKDSMPEGETEGETETKKEREREEIGDTPKTPAIKSFKKWGETEFADKAYKANKGRLPQSELEAFCNYWTEKGDGVKLMLFQRKPTFDVSKRIGTWARNGFNSQGKPQQTTSKATYQEEGYKA